MIFSFNLAASITNRLFKTKQMPNFREEYDTTHFIYCVFCTVFNTSSQPPIDGSTKSPLLVLSI